MARVNLYSDTQTQPTAAMREAIARAEVGDEQRGLDPTVNALQERVAALLGYEAALFLPSGTMCNEIAIRLHVREPGEALYLHRSAHPLRAEAGGPAALSGAVMVALDGEGGMFSADTLKAELAAVGPGGRYAAPPRLVSIENTTNLGGGRVWPPSRQRAVLEVARSFGLSAHLDGARLMNAVVASGVPAADFCEGFDSAWIDFSKGLGAPVGACLAGSAEFIERAWRYKQMLGGAMRQAGIIAAAALYALDHHVERLADDHANARRLAAGLSELPGVVAPEPETNILVFEAPDAVTFCAGLAERGVDMIAFGATTVRAVTHLDVDASGIDRALEAAAEVLAS